MTMYEPLRQREFWEISDIFPTSSSEAHPVRTSAAPTPKVKASTANGRDSISRRSASSESAALVGSLLKTALISELGALTPYSLRWKRSTTPAGRSWFVLATSAPITSGPDHGLSGATSGRLHTPTAMGNMHNPSMAKWESCQGWQLIAGAKLPTPTATQYGTQSYPEDPSRKRPSLNTLLATPRASDMRAGGHGDTGRMGTVRHQLTQAMLPTPRKSDAQRGPEVTKAGTPGSTGVALNTVLEMGRREILPTPTKRDKRMDAWSPAYDKRKSPTMDAVLDGAMTDRAPDKWAYARQIAVMLGEAGLSGPSMTLPITYGWMMGFPPGWLTRALQSAVRAGHLPQASSSRRSGTPSSRKSPKPSAARS